MSDHPPRLPDIERTTVSVRTLIVCLWAMAFVIASGAAISAVALYKIDQHSSILTDLQKEQDEMGKQQSTSAFAAQMLTSQVTTLTQQVTTLTQQVSVLTTQVATVNEGVMAATHRMDAYRPYKWPITMMKQYNGELKESNPSLRVPDVQRIQDENLPTTP